MSSSRQNPLLRNSVARVTSFAATEGQTFRFGVELKRAGGTIDFGLMPIDPGRVSPARYADLGLIRFSFDMSRTYRADQLKTIVIPANVKKFTICIDTVKDNERESAEHFAFKIGGKIAQGIIGTDMLYQDQFWWRTQTWFQNFLFGRTSQWRSTWLKPAALGQANYFDSSTGKRADYAKAVQDAFVQYGKSGSLRGAMQLSRLLEVWLSGAVSSRNQSLLFDTPLAFGAAAVTRRMNGNVYDPPGSDGPLTKGHAPTRPDRHEIIVLGDSITDEAMAFGEWVRPIRVELTKQSSPWHLWNLAVAGSSTHTPTEGLSQRANLDAALRVNPTPGLVVINMTVNGLLRGDPLDVMQADLIAMVSRALSHGAKVLLIGGYMPFWNGEAPLGRAGREDRFLKAHGFPPTAAGYSKGMSAMYDEVAVKFLRSAPQKFTYIQNFWAGLDGDPFTGDHRAIVNDAMLPVQSITQAHQDALHRFLMDQVHPKPLAPVAKRLADHILPTLRSLLEPPNPADGSSAAMADWLPGYAESLARPLIGSTAPVPAAAPMGSWGQGSVEGAFQGGLLGERPSLLAAESSGPSSWPSSWQWG